MVQKVKITDVVESKAKLTGAGGGAGVIPNRSQTVFYNPTIKHQRDVFVAMVSSFKLFPNDRELNVGLPMEASGVRAIRLSLECTSRKLLISANDYDATVVASMRKNCLQNNVRLHSLTNLTSDAFFEQSKGFDIIDLDPFGGPGPFLDMAIKRLARGGLLCVTATDSAVLCGLHQSVGLRSYWAHTSNDMSMHEWAVRILVRYCQLIGAQYDRALVPVLCYKKDHYVRLYLRCEKSKEKASAIVAAHQTVFVHQKSGEISLTAKKEFALVGPMYVGQLVDLSLIDEKVFRAHVAQDAWTDRVFALGKNMLGYYTIPALCRVHHITKQPAVTQVLDALRAKKFVAYVSLDEPESIKSNCSYKQFVLLLSKLGGTNKVVRKKKN